MKPVKLTKPQEALLRELAKHARFVTEEYRPGQQLLSLGLTWYVGDIMHTTAAGRQWIKERDTK
jgi:hypothetical protein